MDKSAAPYLSAKVMRTVLGLLFLGALASGGLTCVNLRDLAATYATADPPLRTFMLYGPMAPLMTQARKRLPESSRLLLVSDADPALIAYGLYPRRIWQTRVDAALSPLFREPTSTVYLERPVETFAVDWVVRLTRENFPQGGEFIPAAHGGK